jgi:hypothetical protein
MGIALRADMLRDYAAWEAGPENLPLENFLYRFHRLES